MKHDEEGNVVGFETFPQLETERLVLRRMSLDDADFYFKHFSDPDIVELTAFDGPKDFEAATKELQEYCLDNFVNDTGIRWGIARKGNPDLIGTCGFYKWVKHVRRAEIGYDLAATFRRQGIMTEALTAMINYLFGPLQLNRLEAFTDPRNDGSNRLLQNLGFKREGVLREYTYFHGRFLDDYLYALRKSDWSGR
jgi:ribosomal-protein-alanine N-acetyltransferase